MAAVTVLESRVPSFTFLRTHQTNDDLLERGNYLEQLLVSVIFPRFLVFGQIDGWRSKIFRKTHEFATRKQHFHGFGAHC